MTNHDWKVGEWAFAPERENVAPGWYPIKRIDDDGNAIFLWDYPLNGKSNFDMTHDWMFRNHEIAPKDPFAPGEYVTCVVAEGFHGKHKGDVLLVDGYTHPDKDWFCALGWRDSEGRLEPLGFQKRCFRPATPEEIAAYKAKYEAVEPEPICASDADLSITAPEGCFGEESQTEPRITFTVGGQEFYVGQRVWVKSQHAANDRDILPSDECEICAISPWGKSVIARRISDMCGIMIKPDSISTTPPAPHEWKRGDWARHEDFGVGFVCSGVDFVGDVRVDFSGSSARVRPETLTFISHSEPPE